MHRSTWISNYQKGIPIRKWRASFWRGFTNVWDRILRFGTEVNFFIKINSVLCQDEIRVKSTVMRKTAKEFNISGWLFFSLVAKSKSTSSLEQNYFLPYAMRYPVFQPYFNPDIKVSWFLWKKWPLFQIWIYYLKNWWIPYQMCLFIS